MIKKISLLFFLLSIIGVAQADMLSQARAKVVDYYDNLKKISLDPTSDQAVYICNESNLNHFFGISSNGSGFAQAWVWANDFQWLGIWDNPLIQKFTPYKYFSKFQEFCEKGIIQKFDYELKSIDYAKNLEVLKEDKEPKFARAIIKKVFTVAGKNRIMWDTLSVKLSTMTFPCVYNESSSHTISDLSIDQLLARANMLYNQRKYEEAGRIYESILKKEPKQEEASYNLAVMYLHGKYGKKQHSRKERLAKAESLFMLSYKGLKVLDYYSSGKNPDIYNG
ncbi:MAG: tetratricopeptide repeat protein [Bacteroidales bacterium]|nr:tetratricopeptide repeat protein [Bacteroidales bacterium]